MNQLNNVIELIEQGEVEKALNQCKELLKTSSDEEKFEIAQSYFNWGHLEEAREVVEDLLCLYPNDGELLIFLSEIMIDMDKEEAAIDYLNNIPTDDPAYVESLLLLADLYQMQGLSEVSLQKLMTAKEILPNEPVVNFALAELFFSQGKYKKAIEFYSLILSNTEKFGGVDINGRVAESLSAFGEFEQALPYYQKAVESQPELNLLFRYGFTALQANSPKTAIDNFLKVKEMDPEYGSLYLYLAKAYEAESLFVESYQAIKDGLKVDELNKEAYFFAANIARKLGKTEEVETNLRSAIAIDPGFIEAIHQLSSYFLINERYDDVVELIHEVRSYGEDDPQFDWDLAQAQNKLEKYSDALNHYRHAYTSFKDNVKFLEEYGYFLLEEGEKEEAIIHFKRILELEPSNVEIEEFIFSLEM
ncbi:tetratricopeptide repeat protein [Bacillus timonensis]|nr:tetratricopeptide repeat protein [Bacillus timonensis]